MMINVRTEAEVNAATLALETAVETLSDLKDNPFHQDEWNANDGLDEAALEWARNALHGMAHRCAEIWGRRGDYGGGYQAGGYYD